MLSAVVYVTTFVMRKSCNNIPSFQTYFICGMQQNICKRAAPGNANVAFIIVRHQGAPKVASSIFPYKSNSHHPTYSSHQSI